MPTTNGRIEEFAKELEVVKEERRMRTEDNPRAMLMEQLYATMFSAHPYPPPDCRAG